MPSRSSAADRSRTCDGCGTRIDPEDRFCSGCGRPVRSTDRDQRGRESPSAEDRAWLRRRVADLHAEGWETVADDGERVVVRKRGVGRLPIHAVLFLLTGGVGNLLYALYRYTSGAPRRAVYADGTERSLSGSNGATRDLATVIAAAAAGLLVFGGAVWAGAAVAANLSVLVAVLGSLVFVLSALVAIAIPQVARDGLESPDTFGTAGTVERERVRNPPEPCAACGRRVFRGEHRRYARRFYVAGVPLRTTRSGENVYCDACADGSDRTSDVDDVDAELDRLREEDGREDERERERSFERG
ncbi:zinc ribbon domain-containing protein [Halobaculum rubrum]|uniref:zinc ribbon domain-containing protein n=1 Tax=Halobaculum rubrum TaxID=2872158 RepID=UPI001CA3A267|nr:zinc ribbon domain-containing protein [Halobaculum rubrum]QZX98860.1 zinc ribbon domain-containing protein [Halobaculum rubrum]